MFFDAISSALLFGAFVAAKPSPQGTSSTSAAAPASTNIIITPDLPDPYPNGFKTFPSACDAMNPSDACMLVMRALTASTGPGGYLYFAGNSGCDDPKKRKMEQSARDAHNLAYRARDFGNSDIHKRAAEYYMGPDWESQKGRIGGNLQRASDFKSKATPEYEYITMSCNDPKKRCGDVAQGAVGGYAWTYNGWWGKYHYINMCEPFWGSDDLPVRQGIILDELRAGNPTKARSMEWLKTSGQMLLHEFMHTFLANGYYEPHIGDEYVDPSGVGKKAYGAKRVAKLARRPKSQGGGVTRASTNADSYAMLANAIYWNQLTGEFPKSTELDGSAAEQAGVPTNYPVIVSVHLGDKRPNQVNLDSLLGAQIAALSAAEVPDPKRARAFGNATLI